MRYKYNTNAFKKIESEEDAYWLGFLLADGYIAGEGAKPFIQIKLGIKDYTHLQKWRKYLGYDTDDVIKKCYGDAYGKNNECAVVKTSCKNISSNLKQYNLSGAKSEKEQPFILHNIELEKAYIRGIIDGDGWIRQTQYGVGVCGSYQTIQYIKDFIDKNITSLVNNKIERNGSIFKLEINGKNKSKKILDYFYADANIYLDRKYILYQQKYCRE